MSTRRPKQSTAPFWSPDSQAIGFFGEGELKRVDLGRGAAQTLAPAVNGGGGTWSADGLILFAPNLNSPVARVSASGGAVSTATTLGAQQPGHRWPHLLPDGRRFLFYATGAANASGIHLGSLDGGATTRLTPADSAGVYLPSGWLLWVRAGALVAQRLDPTAATLTGEPVTLASGVAVDGATNQIPVSVATTGVVAYRAGAGRRQQLT